MDSPSGSHPCAYPHLKPASSYSYGCRCPRCRLANANARRYWGRAKPCSEEGCENDKVPGRGYTKCAEHTNKPPGRDRPIPTKVTTVCCLCGARHETWGRHAPRYPLCPPCRLSVRSLTQRCGTAQLSPELAVRLIQQAVKGCYLCRAPLVLDQSGARGGYTIDHDHAISEFATEESVRGVLCTGCNTSLGGVERFRALGVLDNVMDYLRAS